MTHKSGAALFTIHVTPETGFSYASYEAAGYDFKVVNLGLLIGRVLACFQPIEFSLAVHADFGAKLFNDIHSLDMKGYSNEKSCEDLGMCGSIMKEKNSSI